MWKWTWKYHVPTSRFKNFICHIHIQEMCKRMLKITRNQGSESEYWQYWQYKKRSYEDIVYRYPSRSGHDDTWSYWRLALSTVLSHVFWMLYIKKNGDNKIIWIWIWNIRGITHHCGLMGLLWRGWTASWQDASLTGSATTPLRTGAILTTPTTNCSNSYGQASVSAVALLKQRD